MTTYCHIPGRKGMTKCPTCGGAVRFPNPFYTIRKAQRGKRAITMHRFKRGLS